MESCSEGEYRPPSFRRLGRRGVVLFGCLGLSAAFIGCSDQKSAAAATAGRTPSAATDTSIPSVLATVGGENVTIDDVRARVGDDLDQLETRYRIAQHKLIDKTLQEVLRDRLLNAEVKKQGKSVDQLIAAEAGGAIEPTDVEVAAWYKENQARTGGRSLDQIRSQIADFLRTQRRKDAADRLEQRLKQEHAVRVAFQPFRLPVDDANAPAMGPATASVTLVEFSDFQCPYCGRFHPTLKQLAQNFGDKLRIVYRQYPIPSLHANAFKAAEASLCARDQRKFWEMHDVMFQEQDRLTVKDLKEKAARLSLDTKKFDACLDSGRYTEQVQEDMKQASKVGVTGTPALFVNGVGIEGGAVAYDVVAKAIQAELDRAKR